MGTLKNPHIIQRMKSLLLMCQALDQGGKSLSTDLMGTEREFFLNLVLSNIVAPPFRIGSGDITDAAGNKSGQCDLIIEFPTSISFPMVSPGAPRLYLAEGVCAVIEIKSDLVNQWDKVLASHEKIIPLRRHYSQGIFVNKSPRVVAENIPYFAVGFRGWQTEKTMQAKLMESGIEGILSLSAGIYVGKNNTYGKDAASLFAFLITLQQEMNAVLLAHPNYHEYIK